MRIHLIKERTVQLYAEKHSSSLVSFEDWLLKIKYADWSGPEDIKQTFGHVDFLGAGSNRLVFDVGGNRHRMICSYYFGDSNVHLFVKWIGTHAEYNRLCKNGVQFTVNDF